MLIKKEVKEIYYWTEWFATQWPCPSWFHVPTTTEWQNVYDMWVALWQWSSSNWAWIKTKLKLPLSWYRANNNWSVSSQWTDAFYWCADWKASNNFYAFYFTDSRITPKQFNNQPNGSSVRPFKNIPQVPNSSWITIYQWDWNSWIFHNPSEWLISISSDWITWITLSDKNVWATTVYNTWDTLSEANCWKYFQRWNNYWFPWTWSTTNINTQVNASSYWPWNYYSSDKFFVATYYTVRDSSWNFDLRWWVTWNVNINMAVPIKAVYYGSIKIRPALTSITYNFISAWSVSKMQSDWWVFGRNSWTATSWREFSSNWLRNTYSGSSDKFAEITLPHWANLSNASKITITSNIYLYKWSWNWASSFWITNSEGYNDTAPYAWWVANSTEEGWYNWYWVHVPSTESYNRTALPTGNYTATVILDILNKTGKIQITWYSDIDISLSSSDITTIKTSPYIKVRFDNVWCYYKDITMTVE